MNLLGRINFSILIKRSFSLCCYKNYKAEKILSPNLRYQLKFYQSFQSEHPSIKCEEPFAEFSEKLETIPYLDLLNDGLVTVRNDLISDDDYGLLEALKWTSKVFDHNVIYGKKIRAVALLKTYAALIYDKENGAWKTFKSDGWKSAVILAWCIEMIQAFFIVADDVMDQSEMRRGKPCWYKEPDVGLCAVNDSLLLQCGALKILQKHFSYTKYYQNILHEFLQVIQKTVYGQCLDVLSNPLNSQPRFENFTFENYQTIVKYKTSHYTYCLPVHLAMHLVGKNSQRDFEISRNICFKLGLYFQSQDDYLDYSGDPNVIGKIGNDIQSGKCTWLAVKFLENASADLQEKFKKNYGIDDEKCISTIKELYDVTSMGEKFEDFDNTLSNEFHSLLKPLNYREAGLFYNLFSQISKRTK